MTGTPPATRPPVCSPFLLETLRRLSGERSCDPPGFYVGANTFRSILCSSQFGGLVTSLLQISIVFNNLVSVRFQKFNNIPPEKLFSVVFTCFHFNFYSTLLLNFYSGFSNVTPSDWQVLLWCVTSFLLIM